METKTLSSRPNLFLDGLTCHEETDRERVAAVVTTLEPQARTAILQYLRGTTSNLNETTYKKTQAWGRCYGKGLATLCRKTRNTAVHDIYYDLDIRCCALSILACVLEKDYPTMRFSYIDEVARNRDSLCLRYGVEKTHWNVLLFNQEAQPNNPFEKGLLDDVARAYDLIRKSNRSLNEFVKRRKVKSPTSGCFLTYYLQEVETRILSAVVQHLWEETDLFDDPVTGLKVFAYEYDGIKIRRQNVKDVDMTLRVSTSLCLGDSGCGVWSSRTSRWTSVSR